MAPLQISYPVPHFTAGRNTRVRLLVLHTTEGARTVEALGSFLRRKGTASYHAATDDEKIAYFVDRKNRAWHCRGANPYADGFCLCGFAAWSTAEWLRHPVMLENTAWWLAQCSRERGVPLRHLSIAEVAAVHRNPNHPGGVAMHWDYTRATGDGSHWDLGGNFPWDRVLGRARELAGGATSPGAPIEQAEPEDDMAAVPQNEWTEIRDKVRALWHQVQGPGEKGWETWTGDGKHLSLVDLMRATHMKTNVALDLKNRPGGDKDDLYGHVLSTRAELRSAAKKWDDYINRAGA